MTLGTELRDHRGTVSSCTNRIGGQLLRWLRVLLPVLCLLACAEERAFTEVDCISHDVCGAGTRCAPETGLCVSLSGLADSQINDVTIADMTVIDTVTRDMLAVDADVDMMPVSSLWLI